MIFLYTNEAGFVMKQIRLHPQYRLVQDFVIRKKEDFHFYVIKLKG